MNRISSRVSSRMPLLVLAVALAVIVLMPLAAGGAPSAAPLDGIAPHEDYGIQGEGPARNNTTDRRVGRVAPTLAQKQIAADLGATAARFNKFGSPQVLIKHGGYLTPPRSGTAVEVARSFVRENAALFRLDREAVSRLELVNDSPLYDSPDLRRIRQGKAPANPDVAHVVLFRQTFGELRAGLDGLLTIGVQNNGQIAWATSTATGDDSVSGTRKLDATDALRAGAADVDMELGALDLVGTRGDRWTTFTSDKATDPQRARLVALPTPKNGLRLTWEVILADSALDEHGNPTGFHSFVDAETGKVWYRSNQVEHFADGFGPSVLAQTPSANSFRGSTEAKACGPKHSFDVAAGNDQITVVATAESPPDPITDDDIVIKLYFGANPDPVTEQDLLTSPEALRYAPEGGIPAGTYHVVICPFNAGTAPAIAYSGLFTAGPGGGFGGENGNVELPKWRVFPANPPFVTDGDKTDDSTDTRDLWCWDEDVDPACDEQQRNLASRLPWDVRAPSLPTFTTDGNNASTAISEANFQAPDAVIERPFSPTREYDYQWNNTWYESKCDPTTFVTPPNRNDDDAATTNLFVMHNRMHDWSYYLGFTEENYNLQQTNFGNTGPEREGDPELGQSQAGRFTIQGRDNANQRTLPDGIPGITNQYLWEPLAGAFYAPCVDGDYDMAVVAHEYAHAITNRMIAGPDTPTGTAQGQTESWSDLGFAGYFLEWGITSGDNINPLVMGPYVTGDLKAGIRNYVMDDSPLNYSDLEYDGNGLSSPHANGEIWSATNWDIIRALRSKYNAGFPFGNKTLQRQCARGELPADRCPGNRRWDQIQFDSYLLQPTNPTMVDSRDAMLAADVLRFGGANQRLLWDAFARRGLGVSTSDRGAAENLDPIAKYDSPRRTDEALVTFTAPAGVKNMEVFVGVYEARVTPIADTNPATNAFTNRARFVPGTYTFIARANGYGARRFTLALAPNASRTVTVPMRKNVASATNGAKATGDGVNLGRLIDDTEETNWASRTSTGTASAGKGEGQQVEGRKVTIDLAGGAHKVTDVQVSAALNPGCSTDPVEGDCPDGEQDTGSQSRFSALRSFDIFACNSAAGADCTKDTGFSKIYGSSGAAFPGDRPRPTAPDLLLRRFDVTDTTATHIRLVVRDSQCTGGPIYQGAANPENDPLSNPDCDTEETDAYREAGLLAPPVQFVRAAELQVFGTPAATAGIVKPPAEQEPPTGNTNPNPDPEPEDNDSGGTGKDSGGSSGNDSADDDSNGSQSSNAAGADSGNTSGTREASRPRDTVSTTSRSSAPRTVASSSALGGLAAGGLSSPLLLVAALSLLMVGALIVALSRLRRS